MTSVTCSLRVSKLCTMTEGFWFGEISRQSQAYQVKQHQKGSSPNHVHTQGLSGSILILGTYHMPFAIGYVLYLIYVRVSTVFFRD